MYDVRHVEIPTQGVKEMVAAFGVSVTVPAFREHDQFGIGKLDTGRDWQGPTVEAVEQVAADVVRRFGRLTDA